MAAFTHFNAAGDTHMVNVGGKDPSQRIAIAEGRIHMRPDTLAQIQASHIRKGDVLGVARIAGIMAAKKTADLIPLCHALNLTRVLIDLTLENEPTAVHCRTQVETYGPTGVEIEALQAVQTALLTIYDMCKAIDRGMTIQDVRLIEKSGGRSGHWQR